MRTREESAAARPEEREFARIGVEISARVQPLDESRAARLAERVKSLSSVWVPTDESTLRDMAAGSVPANEALLARAMLELVDRLACLEDRLRETEGPVKPAVVSQLSGGGGLLACPLAFSVGDPFEIQLCSNADGVPPILALGRIVHRSAGEPTSGFRFEAMHPKDQTLLMRFLYRLQREALRRSHRQE